MAQQQTTALGEMTARDVLMVVDVQKDFCEGGTLGVPEADKIVPIIN